MTTNNDEQEKYGSTLFLDETTGPKIRNMLQEQYILIDDRVEITTEVCISDIGGISVNIVDKENKEFCNDGQRYNIHVADSQAAINVIQMAVLVGNIFGKACILKDRRLSNDRI